MKKMKLSDIVAEKIKEMIDHQEYDSNGFLPSEGELAIKYGVSRVTVREAVGIMEARGFVKRIHGKGVQISDNTMQVLTRSIEDMICQEKDALDELLEVRVMVESKGAEIAAERRKEADLKKLRKHVEVMERSEIMDQKYYEADLSFHLDLAKATQNRIHYSFIEAYTTVLHELIIASSKSEHPIEKVHHYHRNVLEAVEQKDGARAFLEMQKHLEAGKRNRSLYTKA